MSDHIMDRLAVMVIGGTNQWERVLAFDARKEIARLREERRSISTLLQKVESLEAENKRLREERRWVSVGERLP